MKTAAHFATPFKCTKFAAQSAEATSKLTTFASAAQLTAHSAATDAAADSAQTIAKLAREHWAAGLTTAVAVATLVGATRTFLKQPHAQATAH